MSNAVAGLDGVSTHSHPKVAATIRGNHIMANQVSTHSHPKVAAESGKERQELSKSFNTQPPEGGCHHFFQRF